MAQTVRKMDDLLVTCVDPTNQDVVKGLLAVLLSGAGRFAARKLEERLAARGMCNVALLQVITVELLVGFGMTVGEALKLDRTIFPPEARVSPVVVTPPLVAAVGVASVCAVTCAVCSVLDVGDFKHTLREAAAEAPVKALQAQVTPPQGKKGNINLKLVNSHDSRSTASITENRNSSPCGERNKDIDALSALINIDALSVSVNKDIDALSVSINIDALSVSINEDIDALSVLINIDALTALGKDNISDDINNNALVNIVCNVRPPKKPNKPLPWCAGLRALSWVL
jgi:hypothetical protein